MARYEDYAEEGINTEIQEAAAEQKARDEKGRYIPERFRDKDISDVIKSYEELEKLNSRQSQDLGSMRKTVDDLLASQASSPAPEPSKPVTVDDIYEDPDAALRRVVQEESSSEIEQLKKELQTMRSQARLDQIDRKFPDWRTKAQSSEFVEWVKESPYRARVAQDADAGDFDAAEEILGMYYDESSKAEEPAPTAAEQVDNLQNAMLESASPASADTDDVYSRSELLEVRLAAKRGDMKADRWLKAHANGIALAYEEGRIVD